MFTVFNHLVKRNVYCDNTKINVLILSYRKETKSRGVLNIEKVVTVSIWTFSKCAEFGSRRLANGNEFLATAASCQSTINFVPFLLRACSAVEGETFNSRRAQFFSVWPIWFTTIYVFVMYCRNFLYYICKDVFSVTFSLPVNRLLLWISV
jgi:hypothetical protein